MHGAGEALTTHVDHKYRSIAMREDRTPSRRQGASESSALATTPRHEMIGPETAPSPPRMGVALLVGLIAACVNTVLVQYVGFGLAGTALGVDYLPTGVLCLFIVLIAFNYVLRAAGIGLRRTEFVIVWVTMLVTSEIGGSGFAGRLIPMVMAVFYYASNANDWVAIFHHNIPDWIAPRDPTVIRMFYHGTNGAPIPWQAWLYPLAIWLVPWAGMTCVMFGLGILLRRRWIERERLTFPLVQVPLAILGEGDVPGFNRALRRDVAFWAAFAVPVLLRFLEGVHFYIPTMPFVRFGSFNGPSTYLQDPAWQALFSTTGVEIHLALVGIAVLMRSPVSASFWVFEWFYLGVGVILYTAGFGEGVYTNTPMETFGYNMFIYFSRLGGTLVGAAILLHGSKEQIIRAWQLVWSPRTARDDEERVIRLTMPLIVGGIALYTGWALAGGMGPVSIAIMVVVFIATVIVVARIIADGGLFWASLSLDPMRTTVRVVGTTTMSSGELTTIAISNHVPMANRGNILPSIMDGFQMGRKTGVSDTRVLSGMALGVVVVAVFGLTSLLYIIYTRSALMCDPHLIQSVATFPFEEPIRYLTVAAGTNWPSIFTMLLGGGLMLAFVTLYRRVDWWPVYPFGFAIAESATMEHMWFSVFLGWAIHVIVMRIWGAEGYKRIKPAAIGFVIGDIVALGGWAIVDLVLGTMNHRLSHEVMTW